MSTLRNRLRAICDNNKTIECKLEHICENVAYEGIFSIIIVLDSNWITHKSDIIQWCRKNVLEYEYIDNSDEENKPDEIEIRWD